MISSEISWHSSYLGPSGRSGNTDIVTVPLSFCRTHLHSADLSYSIHKQTCLHHLQLLTSRVGPQCTQLHAVHEGLLLSSIHVCIQLNLSYAQHPLLKQGPVQSGSLRAMRMDLIPSAIRHRFSHLFTHRSLWANRRYAAALTLAMATKY